MKEFKLKFALSGKKQEEITLYWTEAPGNVETCSTESGLRFIV